MHFGGVVASVIADLAVSPIKRKHISIYQNKIRYIFILFHAHCPYIVHKYIQCVKANYDNLLN